jgi:hypothetical protein
MFRIAPPCLLLLAACAASSAVKAPTASHGWRPLPPSELTARCQGDAAEACYRAGLQALAAVPPDALGAQNLFAAACQADAQGACDALDRHFHGPSAVLVPSLWQYLPPSGRAVVEFACRVSAEGQLGSCQMRRSTGSTAQFDSLLIEQIRIRQPSARFLPATVDGAPYETEVRLIYVLASEKPQSIAGSFVAIPQRYTATGEPRTTRGDNQ